MFGSEVEKETGFEFASDRNRTIQTKKKMGAGNRSRSYFEACAGDMEGFGRCDRRERRLGLALSNASDGKGTKERGHHRFDDGRADRTFLVEQRNRSVESDFPVGIDDAN